MLVRLVVDSRRYLVVLLAGYRSSRVEVSNVILLTKDASRPACARAADCAIDLPKLTKIEEQSSTIRK